MDTTNESEIRRAFGAAYADECRALVDWATRRGLMAPTAGAVDKPAAVHPLNAAMAERRKGKANP